MKEPIYELYDRDYDYLHDIVYELTQEDTPKDQLEVMFQALPKHLKAEASTYGISDSVVRDDIYVYLKEHKNDKNS